MGHGYDQGCDCKDCRRVAAHIERLLAQSPPLTEEQRVKLAVLLEPLRVYWDGSRWVRAADRR